MIKKKRNSSFISWMLSLLAIFLFVGVGAMNMVGTVFAAVNGSLTVTGLSLSADNNGTWNASGTGVTGSATGSAGSCGGSGTAKSSTLTITNTSGVVAHLSFDYTVTLNSGEVTIGGTSRTSAGSYTIDMVPSDTCLIVVKSAASASTTSVAISNISAALEKTVSVMFLPATNGSYKVDGTSITTNTSKSKMGTVGFSVAATPSSGYQFYAWVKDPNSSSKTIISKVANTTLVIGENCEVAPIFIETGIAVFGITGSNEDYFDLAEAYSHGSNVYLKQGGTISGNYTVPSNGYLFIPNSDSASVQNNKATPNCVYNTYSTPSAFATLTMKAGSSITVSNGAFISVASDLASKGQSPGYNGCTTGPHGKINMESGATINLESGSYLYCWGYISGSGDVNAKSGSKVYEALQIRDWKGGTATTKLKNTKVFPISQYYVQNVEANLTINYGANEIVYTFVNANSSKYGAATDFIGTTGMFKLSSGSKVIKHYDSVEDRLIVDIFGTATVSSIKLTISIMSVNSGDFYLPLNSNVTINVKDGASVSIDQTMSMLPGSKINIANGGKFNILSGTSVFVIDTIEWKGNNYAGSGDLIALHYTAANGTRVIRTSANMTDACICVNGTLSVNGNLYTTSSGACICTTENTGMVELVNAGSSSGTLYVSSSTTGTATTITCPRALLKNGLNPVSGNEYTQTSSASAGDVFQFDTNTDEWTTELSVIVTDQTIHFRLTEDSSDLYSITFEKDEEIVFPTFTTLSLQNPGLTFESQIIIWEEPYSLGNFYPGQRVTLPGTSFDGRVFVPFFSGWYDDPETHDLYYVMPSSVEGDSVTNTIPNLSYKGILNTLDRNHAKTESFYFDENGVFEPGFEGVIWNDSDGNNYYISQGVVSKNKGLYRDDSGAYYCFGENGHSYKSGQYYVETVQDYILPSGIYLFDSNGTISIYDSSCVKDQTPRLSSDGNACVIDGIKAGYGLFSSGGRYYYAKEDGTIVKNGTYYVSKTNDLYEEGLYMFDANGCMHDKTNVIIGG